MNVAGGVVLDVRQLLRKHRKPTDSLDDVPGRSTYLEPMMSWRPEKWSHLKNPSEEKEKKKSQVRLFSGIPPFAVFKWHGSKQGHHVLRGARKSDCASSLMLQDALQVSVAGTIRCVDEHPQGRRNQMFASDYFIYKHFFHIKPSLAVTDLIIIGTSRSRCFN